MEELWLPSRGAQCPYQFLAFPQEETPGTETTGMSGNCEPVRSSLTAHSGGVHGTREKILTWGQMTYDIEANLSGASPHIPKTHWRFQRGPERLSRHNTGGILHRGALVNHEHDFYPKNKQTKNSPKPQKFKRLALVMFPALNSNFTQPSELQNLCFYLSIYAIGPLSPSYSSPPLWNYTVLKEKDTHIPFSLLAGTSFYLCPSTLFWFLLNPTPCILKKCHVCNFALPLLVPMSKVGNWMSCRTSFLRRLR